MKVWTTLTPDELRDIAASVGVKIHSDYAGSGICKNGRAWNFRLALNSDIPKRDSGYKYQRVSASTYQNNRRVAAVCWHGHRDFMRAVFARDADARIKSAISDYRGSEAFELDFPATAYRNVGSLMYPMFMKDTCTCSWGEYEDVDASIGGTTSVRMQQSMITACPHVIFTPDHYRADGSCKCDDPHDANMGEWGYVWDETSRMWAA